MSCGGPELSVGAGLEAYGAGNRHETGNEGKKEKRRKMKII